jgi:hypothetical protein
LNQPGSNGQGRLQIRRQIAAESLTGEVDLEAAAAPG